MSDAYFAPPDDDYQPPDLWCLRQLRDCGVVRTHQSNGGLMRLYDQGNATFTDVPGRPGYLDYWLTDAGRTAAAIYLKGR